MNSSLYHNANSYRQSINGYFTIDFDDYKKHSIKIISDILGAVTFIAGKKEFTLTNKNCRVPFVKVHYQVKNIKQSLTIWMNRNKEYEVNDEQGRAIWDKLQEMGWR